jgi:hypothetical protein
MAELKLGPPKTADDQAAAVKKLMLTVAKSEAGNLH